MNAVLNIREMEAMTNYSWNTEEASRGAVNVVSENRSSSNNYSQGSFSTKYPIKTLCFAKKSLTMPTNEEHSILMSCGLGARKWQVRQDIGEAEFQDAITKIYPRLKSVSGYTLWNIKKDKTLEKLPTKVNTPSRIRAYLGNQFSGCILIMPTEEIQLVSYGISKKEYPEGNKTHNLEDQESTIYSGSALSSLQISQAQPPSHKKGVQSGTGPTVAYPFSLQKYSESKHQSNSRSQVQRPFCLVCGKVPKQPCSSPFYDVETSNLPRGNSKDFTSLSKKLREVIKIPSPQRDQLVPSKELCKKCFSKLVDIDFMENQIRRVKEEMMSNFLATVTKVSKMSNAPSMLASPHPNRSSTSGVSSLTSSSNNSRNFSNLNKLNAVNQNRFSTVADQNLNSINNSYPWDMATLPLRGPSRNPIDRRQPTDHINYELSRQQNPVSYENSMLFNNETVMNRGRSFGQTTSNTIQPRSASHDPKGSSAMALCGQNAQFPDIPSIPSSQNGDVGASNASYTSQLYRRSRSSPPRLSDIPSRYYTDIDKMENTLSYQEIAPVNLSSNSSSSNEGQMTMAAVSAERCTDWVTDSKSCIENDLINGNHYSAKDSGDDERKNKSTSNDEKSNTFSTDPSSTDDSRSNAASCGSTPPPIGGSDDSKMSSETETMSPDNEPRSTSSSQGEKTDKVRDHHNRTHDQDHKLNAKHQKQHQKPNRRHRQSPRKVSQTNITGFQKPLKSKKQKTFKHKHGNENFVEKEETSSQNNGASDGNNSGEWTRSSSNTPSPPTSFGSIGSTDNSSSTDRSTESHQIMSSHFPKPFWKKRYQCEDSSESSTTQQIDDNSQVKHSNKCAKRKSDDNLDITNSNGERTEEALHQAKHRKRERYNEEDSNTGEDGSQGNISPSTHLNGDMDRNSEQQKNDFDKQQSNCSPPSWAQHTTDASNGTSTDSGHESLDRNTDSNNV